MYMTIRRNQFHCSRFLQLLCGLLLLFPSIGNSFGATGHRALCQIAFDELTPKARNEVERLMSLDEDFDSFAMSCTFADFPERHRVLEHFVNLPRSYQAITTDDCPMADSCLFSAVKSDYAILRDTEASDQSKLLALKLLGHWVGDAHQPLHVSFQDDRGGNNVDLEGVACPADEFCLDNLHAAWDSLIVNETLGDDFLEIAKTLNQAISAADRENWRHDSVVEWANESFQIAISAAVGYCDSGPGACWYQDDNLFLSPGEPHRMVRVDSRYVSTHAQTVAMRLQQGGVRLAALLNRAFR